MTYTSGPLRDGAQAHIRALTKSDHITDILDAARLTYGNTDFAYRRGSEFNISIAHGKELFELLSEAYLDNVLLIVSGNLELGAARGRELLESLGALSPRATSSQSTASTQQHAHNPKNSTVFDFGSLSPPKATTHRKLGPNHFLAEHQNDDFGAMPSRVFSSPSADPQKWMSNHMILQNLSKKDLMALRLLRRPHAMVVRTVEVVSLLTGRGPKNRPVMQYSILAPLVLVDDLLTELLLLQQDMIPTKDLRKALTLLADIDPDIVRRTNFAAGVLIDWAIAVTTNTYHSGEATFKHGIFARSKSSSGIECIPITRYRLPLASSKSGPSSSGPSKQRRTRQVRLPLSSGNSEVPVLAASHGKMSTTNRNGNRVTKATVSIKESPTTMPMVYPPPRANPAARKQLHSHSATSTHYRWLLDDPKDTNTTTTVGVRKPQSTSSLSPPCPPLITRQSLAVTTIPSVVYVRSIDESRNGMDSRCSTVGYGLGSRCSTVGYGKVRGGDPHEVMTG